LPSVCGVTPYALSVDYGTSNTVAVLRWPDGRTRPLLFDASPMLPSAVYAMPEGHLATGRDACSSARVDPSRFEPNPKRHIDELDLLLGDRTHPLPAIIAATLTRVAHEAQHVAGQPVGELIMTYPAEWGAARRAVLAEAARAAGLPAPRLVPEPVAAGTYFTAILGHRVAVGSSVVVYDLGAGTFDASVVRRTARGFETLAYRGLEDVGGVDLDELVVQLIGAVVGPAAPGEWQRLLTPADITDRRAARALRDDARMLKERLSRESSAVLLVPLVDRDIHVTREEFESRSRTLIAQTVAVTAATMKAARTPRDRLVGLFLVGGSTRMPLVATELHRGIGIAPTVLDQPELVVAEGALLADRIEGGEPWAGPPPMPAPPIPTSPPTSPVAHGAAPAEPVSAQPVSAHPASAYPVSTPPVAPYRAPPHAAAPHPGPLPAASPHPVPFPPKPAGPSWPTPDGGLSPRAEFATTTGSIVGRAALRLLAVPILLFAGYLFGQLLYVASDESQVAPWFLAGPIWAYTLFWLLVTIIRMVTAAGKPQRLLVDENGLTITVRNRPQRLDWAQLRRVEIRRRGPHRRPFLVAVPRPGAPAWQQPEWRNRRVGTDGLAIADLRTLRAKRAAVMAAVARHLRPS
jgi:molecular chaperone DnaK